MRRPRGFTLIELLVALLLFGVIALLAYGALDRVLATTGQAEAKLQRLGELQRAVSRLVYDFSQLAARPVRDGYGDPRPALDAPAGGEPPVAFTRGGLANPAGLPRSSLQRIGYGLEEGVLQRLAWTALDRAPQEEPRVQRLLAGVETFELRYLDAENRWQSFWPPAESETDSAELPRAVEIRLQVEGFGQVTRLAVPAG